MQPNSSRDRHGRGVRGMVIPPAAPGFTPRPRRFDTAVIDAYAELDERFAAELAGLDIAVDTIPRMQLDADTTYFTREIAADGPVPLGRLIPTAVDSTGQPTRARIVVFRRPVEARCRNAEELAELLHRILVQLVAAYLNIDDTDIDPDIRAWD
ncbi:metallopeptidase family protein [Corynebacterium mendelii]|uniref:Metallopeptidase family protein n=1 Tax=Corynebacterium mendelii TaxID=2765362 RepID=A0A939IXH7_9CORY|nr:metallopeptidase family protein [Corynebacterium mendelii]MBN9644480.1 metallopeptidase family protein [Corynebacterium mendelii]